LSTRPTARRAFRAAGVQPAQQEGQGIARGVEQLDGAVEQASEDVGLAPGGGQQLEPAADEAQRAQADQVHQHISAGGVEVGQGRQGVFGLEVGLGVEGTIARF
jgi:hypothetical protein